MEYADTGFGNWIGSSGPALRMFTSGTGPAPKFAIEGQGNDLEVEP